MKLCEGKKSSEHTLGFGVAFQHGVKATCYIHLDLCVAHYMFSYDGLSTTLDECV